MTAETSFHFHITNYFYLFILSAVRRKRNAAAVVSICLSKPLFSLSGVLIFPCPPQIILVCVAGNTAGFINYKHFNKRLLSPSCDI